MVRPNPKPKADKRRDPFTTALRELRRTLPARLPVRVRRCRLEHGTFGDCRLIEDEPQHFRVRVSSLYSSDAQVFALIHEWAHARAWFVEDPDHDGHFGIELARAWKVIGAGGEDEEDEVAA